MTDYRDGKIEQLPDRAVLDEELRQLQELARLRLPFARRLLGCPQSADDACQQWDDGQVSEEGHPVPRPADSEGVVRAYEGEVVEEEACHCHGEAGPCPADHDGGHNGNEEDEGDGRVADVCPEREHDGCKCRHQPARHSHAVDGVAGSARSGGRGAHVAGRIGPCQTNASDVDAGDIEPTGRFRIYLGSAAGVGKTCAMLDEGWRRFRRGTDVVVGFVETHGRRFTEETIRDLEVVPRKLVDYRGSRFEEMDTEAVIARRPAVALIDELAHTNVPGSGPHEKRWQDVFELLDGGIAVVSTVNVQHLESIAGAVENMTGITVRERVPDWVVRRADQIELIDSSPEQLRRRLAHGNIYRPDKIHSALANFFRTDNLTALRELALRFVADETDEALLESLRGRHVDIWDTSERIMVAVDATPGTGGVLRRAARLAARVKGDLQVVHVRSSEDTKRRDSSELSRIRQLSDDLGGDWHEIEGAEPAKAILDFAVENQVTQIVLGSSRRSRFEELTKGSIVSKVIRYASSCDVDVHVIARRDLTKLDKADVRLASVRSRDEGEP